MTTLQTSGAQTAGKSTRDSRRLSAGEATRTLPLPQLPYADAVHAALAEARIAPDVVEAGLRNDQPRNPRSRPELFLRLVWLPDHAALASAAAEEGGLTLRWSGVTGWSAHNHADVRLLPVDALADPALIVDAARHYARHGLTKQWVHPFEARWSEAVYLDIALTRFDEREGLL
ncbi:MULTISPECIES: hypothetical protein [unclassified Streptomyces]|uniref:hypothetical protein n=1 Tax=unclassified Streptomyces TaxID=2593676 RepID=UPI00380170C4